jgi:uncharacterized repeat protein (TIGR01451 family)
VKSAGRVLGLAPLVALLLPAAAYANGGDTVNVSLPALPAGKTVVVRFSATVAAPFPIHDAEVSTQGTVSGSNFALVSTDDPDVGGAADPTVTPIDAGPDLAIAKSDGVTAVAPGATVVYTLGVANLGDQAASTVVVSETVPADTTFHAALSTPGWSCADGSAAGTPCTFALGTVPASGVPTSLAFAVNVVSSPAGPVIVNTATASDDGTNGPDPNPADNTATDTDTLDGPEADLAVTKTNGRSTVTAGAGTEYTITVTNAGPDDVVGATVTDTPPASLTGVTWTCAATGGATCSPSGTDTIADVVDLPAGASLVYTLTATVDQGATGSVANTASVAVPLGTGDGDPGNNGATDTDTVTGRAVVGDFDGDGRSDIALHNTATGEVRQWWMDGLLVAADVAVGTQANANARVAGTGDYDGNGLSDLLWQDQVTGAVELWLNGTATGPMLPPPPVPGPVVGSGDYDGDGTSDVLWLDETTRELVLWLMAGGAPGSATNVGSIGPNRSIRASEDYDNDGRSDLFLMNLATLTTQVRFMEGAVGFTQQGTGAAAIPAWDVAGTGRYGADPYPDVLWHRSGAPAPELWTMTSGVVDARGPTSRPARALTDVAGTGDYDGNGHADILWLDADTGGLRVWLMDGSDVAASARLGRPPSPASDWIVVRVR